MYAAFAACIASWTCGCFMAFQKPAGERPAALAASSPVSLFSTLSLIAWRTRAETVRFLVRFGAVCAGFAGV